MRTFTRRAFASVMLAFAAWGAQAADALTMHSVVLLQPDALMKERVQDVDRFSAYIKALVREAQVPGPGAAASGFIVVALRPGAQSRFWLDFDGGEAALNPMVRAALLKQLTHVPAIEVRQGPVVFALNVGLYGGKPSPRIAPSPQEFREASKQAGRPLEVGELVERIWNEQ
ncbi:hypothetical protein SNE35_27180 [Paucibacter sp. R3-3]|uniref:Uncharacterized protein n=1 Tax=Roseateles agri TaxID=3098619 RepID=A0ABU5DSF0_9BURK|nr:hypothetical protein [Paucibacter sp. R3-3]MDY0748214.1 hypothetical protein [Paucibacter sp. R3-3]